MSGRIRGRCVTLGAVALCALLHSGDQGSLHADDKSSITAQPGVAEAQSLVRALEARARAAQEDLAEAKELLARLEGSPKTVAAADETASLEGVWRIEGIGGNRNGGNFSKPPYDEYKIMTAGHYLWLSFNPQSGEVVRSGGGTYSLKGGVYTARVDYSNAQDLQAITGQEYKGTCRLEGKLWYHDGNMTNGASFDELWRRVH
jgi:hypothetical protein